MRLLLDTCTLLWMFDGFPDLPETVRSMLIDPRNDVFYCDTNLHEVVIKYQLGKLPLPKLPTKLIPALAKHHRVDYCPRGLEVFSELERLPLLHKDPFDRLLIAQARAHQLRLVTPDPRIHDYDVDAFWE